MSAFSTRLGRRLALGAALGAGLAVGGCNRLDDYMAADLHDPVKRHPIAYSSSSETLFVEVAPGGFGLSANQEADVYRFVERYKAESTGSLRIAAPRTAGAHYAVSGAARQVESIVRMAGVDQGAIETSRYALPPQSAPALKLTYDRPVAVPPQCADWGSDLGENRERLPYNDFGCATQRNLALTVANARDLQIPQAETPRSSENRSAAWTKYIAGESSSSSGSSSSTSSAGAAAGSP